MKEETACKTGRADGTGNNTVHNDCTFTVQTQDHRPTLFLGTAGAERSMIMRDRPSTPCFSCRASTYLHHPDKRHAHTQQSHHYFADVNKLSVIMVKNVLLHTSHNLPRQQRCCHTHMSTHTHKNTSSGSNYLTHFTNLSAVQVKKIWVAITLLQIFFLVDSMIFDHGLKTFYCL